MGRVLLGEGDGKFSVSQIHSVTVEGKCVGHAVLIRLQRTLCFELVMVRRRCFDTLLVQLEWKMLWRLIICFMDYT